MGTQFEKYLAAEEKIVYAEIDPKAILKEKWKIDTAGHYSRTDLIRVVIQGGQ
jgi:hypothetical protein